MPSCMFSREHAIRCSALAEGFRDIRSIFTCEGACHSPACEAVSTPVLCQGMRLGWICNKPPEINAATNSRICRSGLPFRKVCFSVGGLPSGQGTKHFGRAAFYEFHSLLVRALCEQRRELPCHSRVSDAKLKRACSDDAELREALGASYMRDCFKAQAFDSNYVDEWHLPNATPSFKATQKMLQKDISTFMQRNPSGTLLVHIDEHRCMCRADPDFRRGAPRVLAELPGVQVVATYIDIPPLPQQKSSETCRRPIACLLPDVAAIMEERLHMEGIDMENEAILLRVATWRVTLGLVLQKLLLAGLHFESSKIDQFLKDLQETL